MSGVYFVDFEASSLSATSFPIEVAWVDGNGQGESHLIRPADQWLHPSIGEHDWSFASERVHGITVQILLDQGEPHRDVARRAAEVLASRRVLVASDAPEYDEAWMTRLLEAGGVRQRVKVVEATSVYVMACRPLLSLLPVWEGDGRQRAEQRVRTVARQVIAQAEEVEARRPRVRHRALADAEGLWRTWKGIRERVADVLAREGAR